MGSQTTASKSSNRLHKAAPHAHINSSHPGEWLRTVEASRGGQRAMEIVPIMIGKPTSNYDMIYFIDLGDAASVLVAEGRGISADLFDIRNFKTLSPDQLYMFGAIQHPNFVTVHEIYRDGDEYYVVFDHMPRSLMEVSRNPYLNSSRLAAIMRQVVLGMEYLEQRDLQHGHLSCSQILLLPSGRVKLRGQENCSTIQPQKDIGDLGRVMMELMEGYHKDSTTVGLDNPERWHLTAVNFLSETTSATSVKELLQHPFLRSTQKEKLKGLMSFVMTWTTPHYEYVGREPSHINHKEA